jgi:hypothetical protein
VGVAEIVGFAICWMFAAVVLTWGVLTERHRRGPTWRRRRRHAPVVVTEPGPLPGRRMRHAADWVVVETLPGSGAEVDLRGELFVAAALAARGLEPRDLAPDDRRTEVVSGPSGADVTRFLVRARVLTAAGPG